MRGQDYGTPFVETATGTARATATHAGTTGKVYYITDVLATTDTNGTTFEIKDGSTTLWQGAIAVGTSNGIYSYQFSTPLRGTSGNSVSITVGTASATALSRVNISGYEL